MKFIAKLCFALSVLFSGAIVYSSESNIGLNQTHIDTQTTSEKPWSINMGTSQFAARRNSLIQSGSGKGVTLNLSRDFSNSWAAGLSYTNYNLSAASRSDNYYNYNLSENVLDGYVEFRPIVLPLMADWNFFAAIDGGWSWQVGSNNSADSLFYGIGASLNYNRQIGFRADMKTYISNAEVTTISLVGYF